MNPNRHGFAILVVLVIITSALLIATSLVFVAQSEAAGRAGSAQSAQARAIAWSGLQVAMLRLNAQRDEIFEGNRLELDDRFEIYTAGGRRGVVRFLAMTPDGEVLAPEAGKLDLNIATPDMLIDTGWVEPDLADSIINYRDQELGGRFRAIEDLLHVPGVSIEAFYGELEELTQLTDELRDDQDIVERMQARFGSTEPRGLFDLFTVDSVEPALQRDGRRRINLNVTWSEALGERIDERFGSEVGALIAQVVAIRAGTEFEDDRVIVEVLNQMTSSLEVWSDILDVLTTESDEFHFGRIDLNAAPADVLAALDGIEPDQAAQMVRVREGLAAESRGSIVWPVEEGIVSQEAFEELAGRVTTRSWRYRVRLVAGEVDADDEDVWIGRPRLYEAVIDLAGTTPRLASLREITMLPIAATLALSAEWIEDDEFDEPWWEEDEATDEAIIEAGPDADPEAALEMEGDPLPPMDDETVEEETMMEEGAGGESPPNGGRTRPGRWRPR